MNPHIHIPMVLSKVRSLHDLFKKRYEKRNKAEQNTNPKVFNPCLKDMLYIYLYYIFLYLHL